MPVMKTESVSCQSTQGLLKCAVAFSTLTFSDRGNCYKSHVTHNSWLTVFDIWGPLKHQDGSAKLITHTYN